MRGLLLFASNLLLFAACDSNSLRPEPERTLPSLIAVTAPEFAVRGSGVLVRVHWADRRCGGADLAGVRQWHANDGTVVLVPEWRWPYPGSLCPDVPPVRARQEDVLVRMPDVGALDLAVQIGEQTVVQRIESGTPQPGGAWTVELLEGASRRPAVGAPVHFLRLHSDGAPVPPYTTVDTLLSDTTDASGLHHVDTSGGATPHAFWVIASYLETWNRFEIGVSVTDPSTAGAMRTTFLVDWRYPPQPPFEPANR